MKRLMRARKAQGGGPHSVSELQTLAEAVEDGLLWIDAAGGIYLTNSRLAKLLGLDAHKLALLVDFDSLVERVEAQIPDPKSAAEFAARWRQHRLAGRACVEEIELWPPVGRVLERRGLPLFDRRGARRGCLEVYRDLTANRVFRHRLAQMEKMAVLGRLVLGIAHDLNNPLTAISGYARLLLTRQGGPRPASGFAEIERIEAEAERASRIAKDLLLFARETPPARAPVQINEIIRRMVDLRTYDLKKENISITTDLAMDLPATMSSEHPLQQVVLNLLLNAEQAIQSARAGGVPHCRGRIHLLTRKLPGDRIAIEFADDGPGVAPEIAPQIFEPFFTTKPSGMGTGLGLSIVSGIVKEHGGEVYLAGHRGALGGGTFFVELPVDPVPAASPRPSDSRKFAAGGISSEGNRDARARRILVVEDEPTVAQLIRDVLADEGHAVEIVDDGRKALQCLLGKGPKKRAESFDLIICDLRMPRLDGRAFFDALVRSGHPAQSQILFITGDTLGARTLEFLEKQSLPYLAKPFQLEELILAIRRQLAPAQNSSAPVPAMHGRTAAQGELE